MSENDARTLPKDSQFIKADVGLGDLLAGILTMLGSAVKVIEKPKPRSKSGRKRSAGERLYDQMALKLVALPKDEQEKFWAQFWDEKLLHQFKAGIEGLCGLVNQRRLFAAPPSLIGPQDPDAATLVGILRHQRDFTWGEIANKLNDLGFKPQPAKGRGARRSDTEKEPTYTKHSVLQLHKRCTESGWYNYVTVLHPTNGSKG